MVTIVQSTAVVAASGIENLTLQLQGGDASNANTVLADEGASNTDSLLAVAGIEGENSFLADSEAANITTLFGAKVPGTVGTVFSNVIQNPSFETDLNRWSVTLGNPGDFVFPVSRQPAGVGFDDSNPVDIPNGLRMAHMRKFEEPGVVGLVQGVKVSPASDADLGTFAFSVASDTLFTTDLSGGDGVPGKYFDVVIEFIENDVTQYTLHYSFTSGELPGDFPSELTPFDRTINLTQNSADVFERTTRNLLLDVDNNFTFDSFRLFFYVGQVGTLNVDSFDVLLDDIVLTIGQQQDALLPTSTATSFITFFPDFSRSRNLFSVVGTSGTVEKFFDRSPFFFGPHETDPNTLRDLSEAQQFLIFTQTTIRSISNFQHNAGSTALISTKGDLSAEDSLVNTNLILNGSFEGGLSNWLTNTPESSDEARVVDSQPTGVGFADGNPVSPLDGINMLYTRVVEAGSRDPVYVKQARKIFGDVNSNILRNFSFGVVVDNVTNDRQNMVALRFLNNSETIFTIHYRFQGQSVPQPFPEEIADFDTVKNITIQSDSFNLILRSVADDTNTANFIFDEFEVWIITNTSSDDTDTLWDDFQLTANVPDDSLLETSSFAHILRIHPTASGSMPFTISGSDDITQVDLTPPFFDELVPNSGTSFIPPETTVLFHVKDAASDLDPGTIDIFIDSIQVVTAGTVQTSATFPTVTRTDVSSRDIQYEATRFEPFPQQSVVTVSGAFADLAAVSNQATEIYEFTILGSGSLGAMISGSEDLLPPTITPTEPVDLDTQISPNTVVSWATEDNAAGVDLSSVKLMLNGALVLSNDTASGGTFTRTSNSNRGFDYTFTPFVPFEFGETVTGTITASDLANIPNTDSVTYEFTITPDDTLEITNFFLNEDASVLLTSGTVASVEVIDLTHGVSSTATELTVNGSAPPGLSTTLSGAGPDRMIFEFPVGPLVTFREDLNILVHAENKFPGPFPVIKESQFTLRPGYDVFWPNKAVTSGGGPETKFPFITNVQVLTEVTNFAKTFNTGSQFFRFLTDNLSTANLGASIEANIQTADLPAALNILNPFFEYGKTMTLEVEVADLEGNQLFFTHDFTIEDNPN